MRSFPRSWLLFRGLISGERSTLHVSRGGRRRRPERMVCGGEVLEGRTMLAVVSWDGGVDGSGTNFLDLWKARA